LMPKSGKGYLITFLCPLLYGGYPLQQWLQEWPHKVISIYSSRLTVASIVTSIVISKFLHYTIRFLHWTSTKSFFQQNFNLNWTRIQHGQESLMLFPLYSRVCWPAFEECYDDGTTQAMGITLVHSNFLGCMALHRS
jgi:hypothetical protein